MIVGLGNPGPRYEGTRHNAGFLVIEELARRHGLAWKKGRHAAEAKLGPALLIEPHTFMNQSGLAVQAYASRYRLDPADIVVVHDDLDMPLGRLRFKAGGGGAGGQKGVADISRRIGPGFARLKIGIGRPPAGWKVEAWVLSRFREDEMPLVDRVVSAAADALELMQAEGLNAAMNRYSGMEVQSGGAQGA
ncbi:MAG TPA: aminoacyl-tRNA hydrolase [Trueperaceae bacterium]